MGLTLSWVAVSGLAKDEVLARLGLEDSGEPAEFYQRRAQTCAELPSGWVLLARGEIDDFKAAELATLSQGARLISAYCSETVMFSGASGWKDGVCTWAIDHNPERGLSDLNIEGDPPPQLAAILAEARAVQAEEGGDEADVDMVFDLPKDLAEALCGWHPDKDNADWGEIEFTRLRRLGEPDPPPKPGWLARLLGR
ncbi:hypothetical protein [Phenylobacterium sp.]|uniref:hypothetical protein n=1 Tax=Phenylobacterium sp. TaxID=1871053 RepID=UPI0030F3D1DE